MFPLRLKVLSITHPDKGICKNLEYDKGITHEERYLLQEEMMAFLKSKNLYSGNRVYPIAHPQFGGFKGYFEGLDAPWSLRTKYTRRRRRVMKHLDRFLRKHRKKNK